MTPDDSWSPYRPPPVISNKKKPYSDKLGGAKRCHLGVGAQGLVQLVSAAGCLVPRFFVGGDMYLHWTTKIAIDKTI